MADTLGALRARNILVETNLISNKALGILKDFKSHPLPAFLVNGIGTCLNTDDSAMWRSKLTDEYMLATELLPEQNLLQIFIDMGLRSLQHAFAPEMVKRRLVHHFSEQVRQFVDTLSCLMDQSCPEKLPRPQPSFYACYEWPSICVDSTRQRSGDQVLKYQQWCSGPYLRRESIHTQILLQSVVNELQHAAASLPGARVCLAEALGLSGQRTQEEALLNLTCLEALSPSNSIAQVACARLKFNHGYGVEALPHLAFAMETSCSGQDRDEYVCARTRTQVSILLRSNGEFEAASSNASAVFMDTNQPYLLRLEATRHILRRIFSLGGSGAC